MSQNNEELKLLLAGPGRKPLIEFLEERIFDESERFTSLAKQSLFDESVKNSAIMAYGGMVALTGVCEIIKRLK